MMDKYTISNIFEYLKYNTYASIYYKFRFLKKIETVRLKIYRLYGILDKDVLHWAFYNGYLDCLKYAYKNDYKEDIDLFLYSHIPLTRNENEKRKYYEHLEKRLIMHQDEHLECLKYIHKKSNQLKHSAFWYTVRNGHLKCLKYVNENTNIDKSIMRDQLCYLAASHGYVECLKYLHENEFQWSGHVCYIAAKSGNLECLKYVHQNGCPYDKKKLLRHIESEWNMWTNEICNYIRLEM